MNKFKRELIILAILLIAISAISIYYYGKIVDTGLEKVPIHWNINNEADRFASPLGACLIGPLAIVLVMVMTFVASKKEYSKIEKKSTRFVILLVSALLVFMNWIALKSALGYAFNKEFDLSTLSLGLGLMFVLLGNQFGKLPYSRWVGIRVPATLNNEEVWNRVHQKSGKYMVISGLFVMAAAFMGNKPWTAIFYIPLLISIILMIFVIPPIEKKKMEAESER